MKTNSVSFEMLLIALLAAPFLYLGLLWNQLPARIVTHYNLQGHANGWMPKETSILVVGGLSLFIYLLLRYLPAIDPKGKLQSATYQKLRFVITLFFAALMGWMWYMAGHQNATNENMGIVLILVSLLLAGMGNYLTTVKPNWFVGIRTPWTLENETVWRKTHQLGGRLLVAGGLLGVVVALMVPMPYKICLFIGIIGVASIVPVIYSYIYFRQEKARQLN